MMRALDLTLPIFWPLPGGWASSTHNRSRFGYTWDRVGRSSWCLLTVRLLVGRRAPTH